HLTRSLHSASTCSNPLTTTFFVFHVFTSFSNPSSPPTSTTPPTHPPSTTPFTPPANPPCTTTVSAAICFNIASTLLRSPSGSTISLGHPPGNIFTACLTALPPCPSSKTRIKTLTHSIGSSWGSFRSSSSPSVSSRITTAMLRLAGSGIRGEDLSLLRWVEEGWGLVVVVEGVEER
ncbi:hypothetical protein EX30DRAFT_384522, partial [Ascodesmis nigricans]